MTDLKTITIDGVDHDFNTFTDKQKLFVAQINNLTQKMDELKFQADQLSVAKTGFIGMLKQSLDSKE